MRIDAKEVLFEKWRRWFLEAVSAEILRTSKVTFLEGMPFRLVTPPKFNPRKELNRNKRFLKDFSRLCIKYAFNPSSKCDQNNFKLERRALKYGTVYPEFCELSYVYYRSLKKAIKDNRNYPYPSSYRRTFRERQKASPKVAERIVYILEISSGEGPMLKHLFEYFHFEFKNDLETIKGDLKHKIKRGCTGEPNEPDPSQVRIPNYLKKFCERSKGPMWASHWKQDLIRSILSGKRSPVTKKLSKKRKKVRAAFMRKLLKDGDHALNGVFV